MRTLLYSLVSLIATALFVPHPATAQITLNMAQVTCADTQAMMPDQARVFAAWISGWFNYRWGYTTVGLTDFERNSANVRQWCINNPRTTVMEGLERSYPQPGPLTGQVKVDMSLLTCRQYLGSDAARREMVAAWMSGYFNAAKNRTIFDYQRHANNVKAVGNFCRKSGNETLMSAIQKTAR